MTKTGIGKRISSEIGPSDSDIPDPLIPSNELSFPTKFRLIEVEEVVAIGREWEDRSIRVLGQKIDKVHKYLGKMMKILNEKDPEFANQFVEGLNPENDYWSQLSTEDRIFTLIVPFKKISLILRYHSLFKKYEEKDYKKLVLLLKKYLRVLNIFKYKFEDSLTLYLEQNLYKIREIDAFKEQLLISGYSRFEAQERERMKVRNATLID